MTKEEIMKQTITILAAFIVSVASAQIKVDSVIPTRLCPGDTITVYYTFNGPDTTIQINMDGMNHDYIWQRNISKSGSVKLKTPDWWNGGKSKISGNWVNTVDIEFCEAVGIKEYELNYRTTYKQVYGNIYLTNDGKKVIFVE